MELLDIDAWLLSRPPNPPRRHGADVSAEHDKVGDPIRRLANEGDASAAVVAGLEQRGILDCARAKLVRWRVRSIATSIEVALSDDSG